ncbi:MAG: hypothetical protein FWE94_08565 [Coriobacteriia bacterium]|nr:hypothetical protein [Coriobacteriia bacterium]
MSYSNHHASYVAHQLAQIPMHVIADAIEAARSAPDIRAERVAQARTRLAAGFFIPDKIAEAILVHYCIRGSVAC